MRQLLLVAALLLVCSVAVAEDKPESKFYVQVEFMGRIANNQDAEAKVAWDAFIANINKDFGQNITAAWRPRSDKNPNASGRGVISQPCLTTAQVATLVDALGVLADSPALSSAYWDIRLSRKPMPMNEKFTAR